MSVKPYEYNEFAMCKSMGDFAILLNLKLPDGRSIGRNKLYEIFYHFSILRRDRMPYSAYSKYFNVTTKEGYAPGGKWITTYVPMVNQSGQEYFKKWLVEWLKEAELIKEQGGNWKRYLGVK
jgi:phage antirepressor YoqD-like protein